MHISMTIDRGNRLPMTGILMLFVLALRYPMQAQTAPVPRTLPSLVITGPAVIVDGATPGGAVLFFAVERVPVPHRTSTHLIEKIVVDTSSTGHVVLTKATAATAAIWCATDLTTGHSITGTPSAFENRTLPAQSYSLKKTSAGVIDRIGVGRSLVEVVLARPGGGVWTATVGDGTPSDADGQVNGRVECRINQMRPIGTSGPPPDTLLPSDTVLVIDPARMTSAIIEVPL
jgi:hypothetical protein